MPTRQTLARVPSSTFGRCWLLLLLVAAAPLGGLRWHVCGVGVAAAGAAAAASNPAHPPPTATLQERGVALRRRAPAGCRAGPPRAAVQHRRRQVSLMGGGGLGGALSLGLPLLPLPAAARRRLPPVAATACPAATHAAPTRHLQEPAHGLLVPRRHARTQGCVHGGRHALRGHRAPPLLLSAGRGDPGGGAPGQPARLARRAIL